jgi:hypothetical protein
MASQKAVTPDEAGAHHPFKEWIELDCGLRLEKPPALAGMTKRNLS